jgi:hypothetical protein
MEGQAFLRSYDSAPRPPYAPSPVSKLDWRDTGRLRKRAQLADWRGGGEGGGRGAKSYDSRKARPSINPSTLSDQTSPLFYEHSFLPRSLYLPPVTLLTRSLSIYFPCSLKPSHYHCLSLFPVPFNPLTLAAYIFSLFP